MLTQRRSKGLGQPLVVRRAAAYEESWPEFRSRVSPATKREERAEIVGSDRNTNRVEGTIFLTRTHKCDVILMDSYLSQRYDTEKWTPGTPAFRPVSV